MTLVDEYSYFLIAVHKVKSFQQRRCLIKYANRNQILALAEVVTNFLVGNIKLKTEENYSLFVKYKYLFRVLGFPGRKSWKKRKEAALKLGKVLVLFLKDILTSIL